MGSQIFPRRIFGDQQYALVNEFIFGGIFDRFPTLQLITGEYECSWFPYWLYRCKQMQGALGMAMNIPDDQALDRGIRGREYVDRVHRRSLFRSLLGRRLARIASCGDRIIRIRATPSPTVTTSSRTAWRARLIGLLPRPQGSIALDCSIFRFPEAASAIAAE